MRVGVKVVVRVLGLAWIGFFAPFAWEYTGQHNAIAASTTPAPAPTMVQPRPAPEATAASGVRVVYQDAVTGTTSVLPPQRAAANPATTTQARPDAETLVSVPVPVVTLIAAVPAPARVARLPVESVSQAGEPLGRVNLNTASVAELNALGAGMIGRAVVAGRPYGTGEDLLSKRVLNRATYARIKDQVAAR